MPVKHKDLARMASGGEVTKKKDSKSSKRKHNSDDEEEEKSEDDLMPGEEIDNDDDDDDDDDEEDEDEENDNYEQDDFLVADGDEENDEVEPEIKSPKSVVSEVPEPIAEEEEEPEEREGSEKAKKKKHKKRRESEDELDDDDLYLIDENKNKNRKRLQKKSTIEEDEDNREPEIEADDDFIENDMPDEAVPKKKRRDHSQGTSMLKTIFGEGYAEEEFLEEKEELDVEDPEERKKLNKKKLEQIFDPAELEEKFETTTDQQIIQLDVPERLQYRYKNKLEDNDFTGETNWIAEKLIKDKGLIDKNTEFFRKNILKVLEFLRINHLEIMYIYTYKINEISLKPGELKLQDLWKIYELDLEWTSISSRRKLLEKKLAALSGYFEVPAYIYQMFNTSGGDKFTLDNLIEWCDFYASLHAEKAPPVMSDTQTDGNEFGMRKSQEPFVQEEIRDTFQKFSEDYFLTSENFAIYLTDPRNRAMIPSQNNNPQNESEKLINPDIRRISSWSKFLEYFCDYEALILYKNPMLRRVLQKLYAEKITICTEPTPKGRKDIDMYSNNFLVKRLTNIPLSSIAQMPELWLRALQCEKDGKITIKFAFRWKDSSHDEIAAFLKDFYLCSQRGSETNSEWNTIRLEVIQNLLRNNMYPFLEKFIRRDLTESSEKAVISECGKKFKDMINQGPYHPSSKTSSRITVISFVPDERERVFCSVVDKDGKFKDYREYQFLLIRKEHAPLEHAQKKDLEEESLKHLIAKHKPDLLVVGADNLTARRLREYLRNQEGKWDRVWAKYGDMSVPKVYAKLDISTNELGDLNPRLKEATSLARLQQNPLAEILKLWNIKADQNGLRHVNFHDLQDMLRPEKLLREFEKIAMEISNQVGLQINRIIKHQHLAAPLQFLCGLGPRKAKNLLETLNNKVGTIQLRRELTEHIGKTVFTNLAGFINCYFETTPDDEDIPILERKDIDLLEVTRIHPDNYRLAQKIAKDALDEYIKDRDDDIVKAIMKNPKKLDELDLDDYAQHLDSKGKQNMKLILDFIVKELTDPFADPRQSPKEMDDQELFCKMTKMHPFEIQRGRIVNARVTNVDEKIVFCRLECGVAGKIYISDALEPTEIQDCKKKFNNGEVIAARIKSCNFDRSAVNDPKKGGKRENTNTDFTAIQLITKKNEMENHRYYLEFLHPRFKELKLFFQVIESEDFPQIQGISNKASRYQPRKINHPKFKNTSASGALEYLQDKEVGDFVVRPSSKGIDHLTITWKFYDKIFVHLDIKESPKTGNEKIGKRLFIKDHSFESLDEIYSGYIQPCNNLVKAIESNPKFVKDSIDRIETQIRHEKEESPKLIPYRFGFSIEAPQFLVLLYAPKDSNIVTEYIKVKHNGLTFHDNSFTSLPFLISWFKNNFNKPEYQKYLRHTKPPIAQNKLIQQKAEKNYDHYSGAMTPTHLGRAWDDQNIRPKTERDHDIKVKSERQFPVKEEPRGHRDRSNDRHRPRNDRDGRDNRDRDHRGGDRDRHRSGKKERGSRSRSNEKQRHGGDYRRDNRGERGDRERERDRDNRGGYDRDRNQRGGDRFDRNSDRKQGGGDRKFERRDSRGDFKPKNDWGKPMQGKAPTDSWGFEPGEQAQSGWGAPGAMKTEDNRGPRVDAWGGDDQFSGRIEKGGDDMLRLKHEHQ